ncbi:MAG: hypothetical protein WEC00_09730 [Dongiaceae bacterium]
MRIWAKLAAMVILGAAPAQAADVFVDEFDFPELGENWMVTTPDPNKFIVENGTLLAITTGPGSLVDATVPNLFQLDQPMPDGDWAITVQFSAEFQTSREMLLVGLMEAPDRYLMASIFTAGDGYYGWSINVGAHKKNGEEESTFYRGLASLGCNVCGGDRMFPNFAETIGQPIQLRMEKSGRQYTVSAKLTGEDLDWVVLEKLTLLRDGGIPTLYVTQSDSINGESLFLIDSFRIEALE